MKIYRSLDDFKALENAVVTIGTFDGVHIGHQKILTHLKECAKKINGETVLLTFYPHPRLIINPDDDSLRLINDIEEKVSRLSELDIDHLIITPFSRDFSNQTPEEYISNVLVGKLGTKKIVIGYDHHFGKDRKGSLKDLQQYADIFDYSVEQIPEQDINDVAVSSTRIRLALITGDINTANLYLGYPFELTGTVIRGDQIGRTIGFPTANLQVHEQHKLIPAYGIYAVEVHIFDHLQNITTGEYIETEPYSIAKGMGYIGTRPTVDGMNRSIEISLFDFNEDIYGKTLRVKFLHFIRHDERFDSLQEMKDQIKEDEKQIRALLF
ncbi:MULTISPECIES: bifunctional riboflavin kinase/FAD synthetase [Sphingobacterium]|jgi:riboflavin kinase/FMN adenylyltransferase|uniref:bifunctional riboflavin kinase/FAD synthetase n=1 Tax=Sphingobacterium TaxID=28453 RepID=UPI0004E5EF05|nr:MULTISPECIES: bifunctional riboflavin kinase/FAD synthetase [Sphingobacterium]CDS99848.1 putative FAD synthetase [Sphingobacterium sp. PM2-P1-29]SJN26066.1 Riboflavin kinase / FMN adenylyltransferase [Sphingobacterium faecium PCAi_F2.5]UPZ36026.1 bifunctional riboflavin kinase/FAD synthetase [Sphingobacterium sp. PCS056]UXD71562.1 bifunctional riboflavin kinase/FAD synthetase [Sphingobacterium faecium]WGQ15216.1 bifunctional riboflavin kinase/FAD synthetase [Sphingobacterium faecium]